MAQRGKYTTGEQIANALTHFLGILFSIYAIVTMVDRCVNFTQAISVVIYGLTLFLLFLSSVFYHSMTKDEPIKFFQKMDHSAIYMLIAGTYTPALMLSIKIPLSVILVALIWALAIVGIVLCCIEIKSKKISTGLYLIMGWLSVFFVYNIWIANPLSVWLLLVGGLFYSGGCVFYLMKTRYMHSIWHLFVLTGAIFHYFAIMQLLIVA